MSLAYYAVELRCPEGGWSILPQLSARARTATEEMRADGIPVRFVRSIFVPEDDACLFLYEGPSVDDVRGAAAKAGLGWERIRGAERPAVREGGG